MEVRLSKCRRSECRCGGLKWDRSQGGVTLSGSWTRAPSSLARRRQVSPPLYPPGLQHTRLNILSARMLAPAKVRKVMRSFRQSTPASVPYYSLLRWFNDGQIAATGQEIALVYARQILGLLNRETFSRGFVPTFFAAASQVTKVMCVVSVASMVSFHMVTS